MPGRLRPGGYRHPEPGAVRGGHRPRHLNGQPGLRGPRDRVNPGPHHRVLKPCRQRHPRDVDCPTRCARRPRQLRVPCRHPRQPVHHLVRLDRVHRGPRRGPLHVHRVLGHALQRGLLHLTTKSTTPTVSYIAADADSDTTAYDFELRSSGSTDTTVTGSDDEVPAGSAARWLLPVGTLQRGDYQVRARATDQTSTGAWSGWATFTSTLPSRGQVRRSRLRP